MSLNSAIRSLFVRPDFDNHMYTNYCESLRMLPRVTQRSPLGTSNLHHSNSFDGKLRFVIFIK